MIRLRSMALLMGVACTLGMFAVEARAGSLEIVVIEGATVIPIADNSALDTDLTLGVINVLNTPGAGINLLLKNYLFTQLGAVSNSPGSSSTGFLTQTGIAQLVLGGTGSITVEATDTSYNLPPAGPGTLHTSSTAEFTNATDGNTNGFKGWYNNAPAPPPPPHSQTDPVAPHDIHRGGPALCRPSHGPNEHAHHVG